MRLVELLPSHSGDISGSARIRTRRITRSEQSRVSGNHPFYFSGMNTSMVITTGSDSSPRRDFSFSSVKSQRELSFNVNNLAPWQEDSTEGIDNSYPFISYLQPGFMDDAINQGSKAECSKSAQRHICGVGGHQRLNQRTSQEKVPAISDDKGRAGAKTFNVGHSALSIVNEVGHD